MNIKKILLFFIFLGILSAFGRSVFSQGVAWDSPSTAFPKSGNETEIFDEGKGPGDTKKRVSPLVFDGVGQAINFGVGQAISGGTNNNAQIMFGPNGIVISSLVGPISLNTNGLILKDYGVTPTAVAGGIALINNELKFNTDGTINGWKLPVGETSWNDENVAGGFYFDYSTNNKDTMSFTIFHAAQLSCDTNPNTRDCGDFVSGDQADGGYDKFTVGGVENLAVYKYKKETAGISYIVQNGYSYDKHDEKVNSFSILNYKIFWTKLGCDTSDEFRECGDFYAQAVDRQGGYDVFKKDGNKYVAEYSHKFAKVIVGSDIKAKDLVVSGSVKLSGQLLFSPKTVFESEIIRVESNGSAVNIREIKNETTGKKDFSFCAVGYQLYDKKFSNTYTGVLCSVYYDGIKKSWILKAQRLRDDNIVECGAICF